MTMESRKSDEGTFLLAVSISDKLTMIRYGRLSSRSKDTFVRLKVDVLYMHIIHLGTATNVILGYVHRNQQFTLAIW